MRRRAATTGLIVSVALAVGLGLAGCGSDDGADGRSADAPPAEARGDDAATSTTIIEVVTTLAPQPTTSTTRFELPATTQPTADPGTEVIDLEVGAQASWSLDPAFPVTDDDTSIHVLVRPYECAGRRERTPLRPGVRQVDGQLRITTDLSPLPDGFSQMGEECIDQQLPLEVVLDGPVAGRPLVDASCLLTETRAGPTPPELCVQRP